MEFFEEDSKSYYSATDSDEESESIYVFHKIDESEYICEVVNHVKLFMIELGSYISLTEMSKNLPFYDFDKKELSFYDFIKRDLPFSSLLTDAEEDEKEEEFLESVKGINVVYDRFKIFMLEITKSIFKDDMENVCEFTGLYIPKIVELSKDGIFDHLVYIDIFFRMFQFGIYNKQLSESLLDISKYVKDYYDENSSDICLEKYSFFDDTLKNELCQSFGICTLFKD